MSADRPQRRRPRSRSSRSLAVSVLFATSAACGTSESEDRLDAIVITVDTLRPDHLGAYGYRRATSPALDALARDSIVFENAVTTQPRTAPSLASMWTSLYPPETGVVTNRLGLNAGHRTLAEILRERGWSTAAFVSSYVLIGEISQLDQGFDLYDDWAGRRLLYGTERPARETVDRVLAWLARGPERPFFLWVHLMDPHGPYTPPSPFDERFESPPGGAQVPRGKIAAYQFQGRRDLRFYRDRYDGEIAYADHEIGRLLAGLREAGTYDDALIVAHSDHGEGLGERGVWLRHAGHLVEQTLRIPLLLKLPRTPGESPPPPGRSDRLASVLDVAPTVLDVLRVPVSDAHRGRSLLRVLREPAAKDRRVFIEARSGSRHFVGVRSATRKLVHRRTRKSGAPRLRYERLSRRSMQSRPLPLDAEGRRLLAALRRWEEERPEPEHPPVRTAPATRDEAMERRAGSPDSLRHYEALRSLGYLE